jgi:DNA-binding response OmpR family regulator
MKILVADDDPVSRHALQAMLRKRGHQIVTASDGEEAWQILRREDPPKIAVLNWLMPSMDGTEICRRVRASVELNGTYLILITPHDTKEHIVECLEAGANDCVTMPFDNNELLARVNVGVHVRRPKLLAPS